MAIGLSLKKDLFENVSLYPHCLFIIEMVGPNISKSLLYWGIVKTAANINYAHYDLWILWKLYINNDLYWVVSFKMITRLYYCIFWDF